MVGAGAIPENGIADGTEQTVIPAITGNGEAGESNAEYIIAACNSLPDLLDALEEAQVEIERITKRNSKITERRRVMYYKIIGADNRSCNGGDFDWTDYLPVKSEDGWTPGKWTPVVEDVELCERGYHVMDKDHLIDWINAQCFEAEVLEPEQGDNKYVCKSIRLTRKIEKWNDKNLRLFACWCARQVWGLLADEGQHAVEVSERYAVGEAADKELSAAWAAARDAARAAAMDAAWAAAMDAARAAARDAADATRAAASAAAWAAQKKKLVEMMLESEER